MAASSDKWILIGLLLFFCVCLFVIHGREPFFLWTAAGVGLLLWSGRRHPESRAEFVLLGILMLASLLAVDLVNHVVMVLTPTTIDGELAQFGFGLDTGFYHWALRHVWIERTLRTIYLSLPFFFAWTLSVSPRRVNCALAWIFAAIPAPFFYVAFPATGPAYLGSRLVNRNCMPSLHMTWALICLAYVPQRWRPLAIAFAVVTALATIATGEHYLIDLVAAVPYTWMICYGARARDKSVEAAPVIVSKPGMSAAACVGLAPEHSA